MELLLFIKDLRKKGNLYYDTWMPLLLQLELKDSQRIKLSSTIGIPRSTYHRIIEYGVKVFPNYIKNFVVLKQKNVLIINIINNNILSVKKEPQKMSDKEVIKEKPKLETEVYEEIISYLNETTGQAYKANSKQNQSLINARIKEGHTINDFKQVIATKATKWLNTQFQDFLRPQTLFGNKFESYLNESVIVEKTKQQKAYDTVNKATDLGWKN
jgi:uncharacterized phage protein (TIGR02220 family)